jgi:VWFA-related protein
MRAKFLAPLLAVLTSVAQQPPQQTPPAATDKDGVFQIKVNTQLVIETVSVKDKSGKPIEGLTAKDFIITEDGKPQTISFCEFQQLKDTPEPLAPVPTIAADAPEKPKVPGVTSAQIAPERPGDIRYKDRRLIGLYFDMSAMPVPDQLRSLAAAEKFVKNNMAPADLMAIMTFSGGAVKVTQDFTPDRTLLLTAINKMVVGEGQGLDENPNDDSSADTGAAFGQDDGEFNIFNTDRQLAALQTAVSMLSTLNEKKALVYFASGLRLNGVDNQAQLQATTNAAIRANVSFYPIDARGLVASAPLGDATHGSPGGIGMYSGSSALAASSGFQRSQDTLYALGADTGGKALLDYNDLGKGIQQAQQSITSYYIIGYYTTNDKLDGKFRRIKLSLANNLSANVTYRQGYYTGKQFAKFTAVDKERQLEDALMLGDPITDLTIAMEVDYFQLNRAEYFVPVTLKIPGSELAKARKGGAEHTLIDFIGEVKDEFGTTVSNVRDKVNIKLTGETAEQLAKQPVQYGTGFTLLPGTYNIKVLARDDETGRIGTFLAKVVVPNLNKEEQRIPISSVILSSQQSAVHDALFTAKDKVQAVSVNPLVHDGQQLMPSVTRVFSRAKDMYVYLQAYERTATTTQPLVAFVTFYRGQVKAFETEPLPVTEGLDPKSKAVPLRFSLALSKLPTGRYNCQVTVVDPTGQKAAFWQAPIVLVP